MPNDPTMLDVSLSALGAALFAGLAAIPHCAGMCGPLVAFASTRDGRAAAARYHGGRLLAYTTLGLVVGATGPLLGSLVGVRWAGAVASWSLALALALAARRLWGGTRRPPGFDAEVPLRRRASGPSLTQRAFALLPKEPFVLGLLTALLPCGVLASALLLAAGAGSVLGGGLAMLLFAAVSATGLALVSTLARGIAQDLRPGSGLARALATALIVGAMVLLVRPLSALTRDEPAPCHVDPATGPALPPAPPPRPTP
ncbi:MAG: sulfite exporter TauE/SafE family protein [Sandaracinaceae bacterium]